MPAQLNPILHWCASLIGDFEIASDDPRFHGRTTVIQLVTPTRRCFLKVYGETAVWESEVHGYEQWAPAFGSLAPQLLGVYDGKPRALLVDALPGTPMEVARLSAGQQASVWQSAGRALASLHGLTTGSAFGACRRNGAAAAEAAAVVDAGDAAAYVSAELERVVEQGARAGVLSDDALAVARRAQALTPAFAGERPTPCHRDYGPANWLVSEDGRLAGIIDFEFSRWDVRAADFSRYPDWEWLRQPELMDAFFDGYGQSWTPQQEQQLLVARTQYALEVIVWGSEHGYLGFVDEGRRALERLAAAMA